MFEFEMPKNRAGKIIFHKTLQVHFRLPKESEKKQGSLEVKYTFKEGQKIAIPDLNFRNDKKDMDGNREAPIREEGANLQEGASVQEATVTEEVVITAKQFKR